MKTKPIVIIMAFVGVGLLTGCATAPKEEPKATTLRCTVPVITRLAETKESQDKGGVVIAVVPALYKGVRADKLTIEQADPPADISILFGPGGRAGQVYVKETVVPELRTQPNRLQFTVRINNNLPRVFRGQGSVVQFNVAGKLVPFGNTDYREFINGIIPPRNETTLNVYGPSLDSLADKGTIGIFVYDVVTATDAAGNPTEKQNYEWYFDYTTKAVEETAATKVAGRWMSAAEYQQRVMKDQQERMMREQQEAVSRAMQMQLQQQPR